MIILGIDTTSKTAACALLKDGVPLAEYSVETGTHSTVLLPMIENMLGKCALTVKDVDLIACSVGPGSFTGVRIGVSTAKGLAFAYNTPCVGVSSLEAVAYSFSGIDGIVIPALDARRNTIYTAAFDVSADGNVNRIVPDEQIEIAELSDRIAEYSAKGRRIFCAGDAYMKLHEVYPGIFSVTPPTLRRISGTGVALAAQAIYNSVEDKSVFTDAAMNPVYLKKCQAERERDERLSIN